MSQEKGTISIRKKGKHRIADLGPPTLDKDGHFLLPRNACVCEPMPKSWVEDDIGRLLPFCGAFDKNCRDPVTNRPMQDHPLSKNTSTNRLSIHELLVSEVFNEEWSNYSKAAYNLGLQTESKRLRESNRTGPSYSFLDQTPSTQGDVINLLGSDEAIALAKGGHVETCCGAVFTLVYALSMQTGPNSWAVLGVENMIKRRGWKITMTTETFGGWLCRVHSLVRIFKVTATKSFQTSIIKI